MDVFYYLLLLFPITWCSLGKVTAEEFLRGSGIGHFLCSLMSMFDAEQLWATVSSKSFAGMEMCHSGTALRSSPWGNECSFREVWAWLAATWNKSLRSSKPSPQVLDVRRERCMNSFSILFHLTNFLWGFSALILIVLVYILIKPVFFELKSLFFFLRTFYTEEGWDRLPQSSLEVLSHSTIQTSLP